MQLLSSAWWNLVLPVILLGEEILWDKHYLHAKRANRQIKITHCWAHKFLHLISSSYIQWEGQWQGQPKDYLRELLPIFIPNTEADTPLFPIFNLVDVEKGCFQNRMDQKNVEVNVIRIIIWCKNNHINIRDETPWV